MLRATNKADIFDSLSSSISKWQVWGYTPAYILTKKKTVFKRIHYIDKEISSGR